MTMEFGDNGRMVFPLPGHFHSLVYVLNGSVESEGVVLEQHNLGVFESGEDAVVISAKSAGRLLFLAGEPIHEPVASYGPFVMNYPGDIKQAILDYETGKMGVLES
jgi:quercetin 2,3-dioxygenase